MLDWLFNAHVVIAGHPILWREIAGNLFGFASALGGMRRRVWAWPVGIVGNALLFTVFVGVAFTNPQGATLWGQAGRQVFFILASLYGWWRWTRNRRAAGAPAVRPRWASAGERAAYLLLSGCAVGACFLVFRLIGTGFPAPWWYYLADAWIFVGSILATLAMARGWIDFWLCWIAVDLVGVPELVYFRFYPSAVLYGVYGGFVLWGFGVWLHAARVERPDGAAGVTERHETHA